MNRWIKIISLVCICISWCINFANATKVLNIKIEGTQRIENDVVLVYLPIKIGDDIDNYQIDEAIKKLFGTGYFANVSISIENNVLLVKVIENPIINDIMLNGISSSIEKPLKEDMQTKIRGIYSKEKIRGDTERIKAIYYKSGKFGTSVIARMKLLDKDRVDIIFDVHEGKVSKVRDIVFVGNHYHTNKSLENIMKTKGNNFFTKLLGGKNFEEDSIDYDVDAITNLYLDSGFADFSITKTFAEYNKDSGNVMVSFFMEEGKMYKFGKVNITSNINALPSSQIPTKLLKIESGKSYSKRQIKESIDNIGAFLSERGFAFAAVNPEIVRNQEGSTIDVNIIIQNTRVMYIDRIDIVGNYRTYDYVIRRELSIKEGDPYDSQKIKASRERLEILGFFDAVSIEEKRTKVRDLVDLTIHVKERKSTTVLNFSAGYSSLEKLVANITFAEMNLLGRGYAFNVGISKSVYQQTLNIGVTNPKIFNTDLSLGVDAYTSQMGSAKIPIFPYLQISKSISIRSSYPIFNNLYHAITMQARTDDIRELGGIPLYGLWRDILGDRRSFTIGQAIILDKRDNVILPNRGYILRYGEDYGGVGGLGTQNYISREALAAFYVPVITDDFVFSVALQGGVIRSNGDKGVDFINRFRLITQMRGFLWNGIGPRVIREDANGTVDMNRISGFGGNNYFVTSIELTTPTPFPKEYGFRGSIFCDIGTLYGIDGQNRTSSFSIDGKHYTEYIRDSKGFRVSAGIGLIWVSPFGPLRVDWARPIIKDKYDIPMEFRISFSTLPY